MRAGASSGFAALADSASLEVRFSSWKITSRDDRKLESGTSGDDSGRLLFSSLDTEPGLIPDFADGGSVGDLLDSSFRVNSSQSAAVISASSQISTSPPVAADAAPPAAC